MTPNDFEAKMRQFEYFHSLRVLPGTYPIIRVDGRGFSQTTKKCGFEKPFDRKFHEVMVKTASALLENFGGIYAYTESDEISVLLPKDSDIFDRSLEKLVSCTASMASAVFNCNMANVREWHGGSMFDSRVSVAPTDSVVADYFSWRQSDAGRCCLNGYAHWLQVNEGKSPTSVGKSLEGVGVEEKMEILFSRGINFADLPGWQRNGTGLYPESYQKEAMNPKTGDKVTVTRRRTAVNEGLPIRDEYRAFILALVRGTANV